MFFFALGIILSVLIYFKLIKPCHYWKSKGIKYAKSWPVVGSMGKVMMRKQPYLDVALDLYSKFPEERYVGYTQFSQQCLLIRDIDLIKQITIKDFDHFTDHAFFGQGSDSDSLMNKSLVSLRGQNWKDMRLTLNPAFSSNKLKNMFHLIDECAEEFVKHFDEEKELEMRDTFAKFTVNVIASTAFGEKINCLEDPKNEFFTLGTTLTDLTLWQTIKLLITQTNIFKIEIFPKKVTSFFRSVIKNNIQKRETGEIVRPDLIHLLMEARKGKLKNEDIKFMKNEGFATAEVSEIDPTAKQIELTDDDIVAQAMLFFFAGFDTVSTAASFMSYELAINPDIQKKLQEEIDSVKSKHSGKIPYDALLSMKYLDQVVSETLRLWPAAFETDRLCVKDYQILVKDPEEQPFLFPKGVTAVIPIMAIHRDPEYFPEPTHFDPERFNDANKSKITPETYMPFGLGPRNCIGSRFALLEIKTVFCHLLSKFDVVPIKRTQIPVKIDPRAFNMAAENGLWLGFKPRKETSC